VTYEGFAEWCRYPIRANDRIVEDFGLHDLDRDELLRDIARGPGATSTATSVTLGSRAVTVRDFAALLAHQPRH
jgi:hypothetical protein